MPECRHCAGLKKQSSWKYEIRTRSLPSTSPDRYRYAILLCSISKHKMEFTIVCWTLIDTIITNLSAGYHGGRTAPCTGPLFYLTIIVCVCHFRSLLRRSDEWATSIFFPPVAQQTPSGPGPPHCRDFATALRHTTPGGGSSGRIIGLLW